MPANLEAYAKDLAIKYFLFNFTDLRGVQRSKLVPASAAQAMQEEGAGFAGFATYLDLTPAHPDMFAVPDTTTVVQLPWKQEVAWVAGDLFMDGAPVEQAPRFVLQRLLQSATELGLRPMSGVEAEFHLINSDGSAISDERDTATKPCYDQSAVMRRYDVIAEICDAMLDLGWGPYQNDHEDSNGQFEMNWGFADSLTTADRHAFFKFMVKSIAEKHGLRATFMPKPFSKLTGNGCHVHMSLWNRQGTENLMHDDSDELGLSKMAYHFLAGIMQHAAALCILTNPTVNSYKRINAPQTVSGATWSPNTITWTGNNRTHLVRVPGPDRVELRQPDGAANPYLLQAAYIAAGLDGIRNEMQPQQRLDIDMYAYGHTVDAKKLPSYLVDAIRLFEKDSILRDALGASFCDAYIKMKKSEWDDYSQSLTSWERRHTLDC